MVCELRIIHVGELLATGYSLLSPTLRVNPALDSSKPLPLRYMTEYFAFAGQFHPLFLHLPIGLFSGLVFLELLSLYLKDESLQPATRWLAVLMAASSFVAAFFGWCLEEAGTFDPDAIFWHKWLTIGFMVMTFVAAFWKFRQSKVEPGKWKKVYWAVIGAAGGLMTLGGHHGGVLTHGEFDPPPFLVAEEEEPAYEGDFSEVWAILAEYCIECHGKKKQKGKLRLDTLAFTLEGGEEDGPSILYGSHRLNSPLIERIVLPEKDKLVMPPEDKKLLNADQILTLIKWVEAGAPWPDQVPHAESVSTPEPEPEPAIEPPLQPVLAESANPWALPPPGEEDEDGWDGAMPAAGEPVSFRDHIWPMIKAKCVRCHREDYVDDKGKNRKAKGELRLDSPDWIKKGGENDDVVVAGKPADSSFYFLLLEDAEDDIMPPKGDPLTAAQADAVSRWIAAGASFE